MAGAGYGKHNMRCGHARAGVTPPRFGKYAVATRGHEIYFRYVAVRYDMFHSMKSRAILINGCKEVTAV